ncbi:A/G-specific adenine glycosylase [Maribacter hydrothermalis]|uniref:Adenine DNA glycosylase n=1 Tax=Maribacter hydrothermalis TaxID=1836467 RepID=A0A1B7Z3R4_9FLAO|nr:A/G-specific adenine glycosylase [Maribacter hydrothermalis]APQ17067.1 A/G-specific adenine glycosylase [Maribacter hydrothermalis]OBR37328.1 A/G-specific adenine glycosylase [Maribacter hydrothermalis]
MSFSGKILDWYHQNKRTLPWRNTIDPYNIWLSEIILQQTRVAQGTPYYLRFIESFPTVGHLANADEEEVLKLWQGLGYYSRARNLHATAKIVVNEYKGVFPDNYKELLNLKGIGDYTASAISSICFNEAQAVVDGNVYRVLARYYGVDIPINSTEGVKYFKTLAQKVMDTEQIRDYNQGIMEFGAIQCSPKKPLCLHCPLNNSCVALQKGLVEQLPVKLKKTKVRDRYFNYIIPIYMDPKENYFTKIEQRIGKGIWQNLWQFPLLESKKELELDEIIFRYKEVLDDIEVNEFLEFNESAIIHKLSHQHLHAKFWIVKTNSDFADKISMEKLKQFPVPVLIADFIKAFKI